MVVIAGFDTAMVESYLESYLSKSSRKKALSAAGPLFLVVTFIEDGLRIFLRWGEQVPLSVRVEPAARRLVGAGGAWSGTPDPAP